MKKKLVNKKYFRHEGTPGFLIRRLHQHSVTIFTGHMKQIGVDLTSVQFAAIAALADHPEIDQSTLAKLIVYDTVTISGVVDRLVRKGFVSRHINASDRRARILRLTTKGKATLDKVDLVVRSFQPEILSGLTVAERKQLASLLKKATTK